MSRGKRLSLSQLYARRLRFSLINQSSSPVPNAKDFERWVFCALTHIGTRGEIAILLCDEVDAQQYNHDYRQKDYATNVLSFDLRLQDEDAICGNLVICPQVVAKEAAEQNKTEIAHFAHLTVHGTLHVSGFDHKNDADAAIMETHEITILKHLGYDNPYESKEST